MFIVNLCLYTPSFEKTLIIFSVIYICQLLQGKLDKRVLLISISSAFFYFLLQYYYSAFISFISLEFILCYCDPRPYIYNVRLYGPYDVRPPARDVRLIRLLRLLSYQIL